MTEEDLADLFYWYETHSYHASRPDAEMTTPFTFTLRTVEHNKKSYDYKRWHANMMARFYNEPGAVVSEPERK